MFLPWIAFSLCGNVTVLKWNSWSKILILTLVSKVYLIKSDSNYKFNHIITAHYGDFSEKVCWISGLFIRESQKETP